MAQHDYILDDASGIDFRADLNGALAAIKTRNSHATTPPASPVQGMLWCKTVSSTVQEAYEYDGANWVLIYVINPTTHEIRSVDGNRRSYGGVAGGTANALTITTSPAISGYENGQRFVLVTGAAANTGAMTLAVDGQSAIPIKIEGVDPASGDVPAASVLEVLIVSSVAHVVGGVIRPASTSTAGKVRLADETNFLAGVAGRVPTADVVRKHVRERLYANRTYYVRTDGNDANTGLVDSAGGAFLTIQKAWDTIRDNVDMNGFTVTVQIKDGTYANGLNAVGPMVGQSFTSSLVFQGNASTPTNVKIALGASAGDCVNVASGARFILKDVELSNSDANGEAIYARDFGLIDVRNVRFGACAGEAHMLAERGFIDINDAYAIVGAAKRHYWANSGGRIECYNMTVTISGTLNFSTYFANASESGDLTVQGVTYSGGTVTGTRYRASTNGTINTNGGGANFFPGNAAGSTATGGQYV